MLLHFKTNSGTIATLGTGSKVHKDSLKRYIKMYPLHWITV